MAKKLGPLGNIANPVKERKLKCAKIREKRRIFCGTVDFPAKNSDFSARSLQFPSHRPWSVRFRQSLAHQTG
jgi:hypothetical protein